MSGARIVIEEPGLATTVQDLGRAGLQRLGVPPAGALDPDALRLANALVGAAEEQAALEIRYLGPTLRVEGGPVRVALAGATAAMRVTRADGAAESVSAWRSVTLAPGDRLKVGPIRDGATAVLALTPGLALAPALGSRATFAPSGFGGFEGRALQPGDALPLVEGPSPDGPELALPRAPDWPSATRVRVVLGPQDDYFTRAALETLLCAEWRVTANADRMGLRLEGPTLEHSKGANVISDGIVNGAIQVPGAGQPILLLVDRGTSGGYPKIATAISADLPGLGRAAPGARLRFEAVEADAAAALAREAAARRAGLIRSIGPLEGAAALDLEALYRENLISAPILEQD